MLPPLIAICLRIYEQRRSLAVHHAAGDGVISPPSPPRNFLLLVIWRIAPGKAITKWLHNTIFFPRERSRLGEGGLPRCCQNPFYPPVVSRT